MKLLSCDRELQTRAKRRPTLAPGSIRVAKVLGSGGELDFTRCKERSQRQLKHPRHVPIHKGSARYSVSRVLILYPNTDFDSSLRSALDISYKPPVAYAKQSPPPSSHLLTSVRRASTRKGLKLLFPGSHDIITAHYCISFFGPAIRNDWICFITSLPSTEPRLLATADPIFTSPWHNGEAACVYRLSSGDYSNLPRWILRR